ncbi:MAG: hypothetical protein J5982_04720 [Bacilli bacterium]|nr:hypothetical protein [Bacilli bacterium]
MEKTINSQTELYKKVLPALRTKRHELLLNGIKIVKEIDIWNYNKEYNWKNAKNLTLASMVDNILNTSDKSYEDYVIDKLNNNE